MAPAHGWRSNAARTGACWHEESQSSAVSASMQQPVGCGRRSTSADPAGASGRAGLVDRARPTEAIGGQPDGPNRTPPCPHPAPTLARNLAPLAGPLPANSCLQCREPLHTPVAIAILFDPIYLLYHFHFFPAPSCVCFPILSCACPVDSVQPTLRRPTSTLLVPLPLLTCMPGGSCSKSPPQNLVTLTCAVNLCFLRYCDRRCAFISAGHEGLWAAEG